MSNSVWQVFQMVVDRFVPPPPPPPPTTTTASATATDARRPHHHSEAQPPPPSSSSPLSPPPPPQQQQQQPNATNLETLASPAPLSTSTSAISSSSTTTITTTTTSCTTTSETTDTDEQSYFQSSDTVVHGGSSTTTSSSSSSASSSSTSSESASASLSAASPPPISNDQSLTTDQSGQSVNGSSEVSSSGPTHNDQQPQPQDRQPDEPRAPVPYSLTMNLTFNIRHHHHLQNPQAPLQAPLPPQATAHPHPLHNHNHHHQHHQHHHLHHRIALPFPLPRWLLRPAIFMDEATALAVDLATGGRAVGAAAAAAGLDIPEALHARTRHRLYSILLLRAAMAYFLMVPHIFRRVLEYTVLAAAILSLALLIHLHVIFIRSPLTCLDEVKDSWPREGILRVQIGSYLDHSDISSHETGLFPNLTGLTEQIYRGPHPLTLDQYRLGVVGRALTSKEKFDQLPAGYFAALLRSYNYSSPVDFVDSLRSQHEFYYRNSGARPQPYMVEYSLEYGLLRLSDRMRAHYKVPVMTVTLCPEKDACFGDPFARFMLRNFLGYDDVLIGSIKRLAEHENNRGYVRNVATGEHFRFVNVWMTRASYLAAGFIMIVFTLFLSMLIRYTHHLIFVCISEFLRSVELQLPVSRSPATRFVASLITTILAFIGMEAIMYEFFADSSIAFHLIIMVWAADQFDSMAVRSRVSKRYFLRFFYLYQFAFYAYHYRFNGQYAGLAMLTTMLFTYHSMIYFFHHYELPYVQAMEQALLRRAMNGGGGGGGVGAVGVDVGVADPEVVNHNNNNNNQGDPADTNESEEVVRNDPSSPSTATTATNTTVTQSAADSTTVGAHRSSVDSGGSASPILGTDGRIRAGLNLSTSIHHPITAFSASPPTLSTTPPRQASEPRSLMEYEID